MHCPVDGTTLVLASRDALEIDYCPDCRGVWLDGGELDVVVDSGETISLEPDARFLRAALIDELERLRAAIARHTATLGELDVDRQAREHASFARAQAVDALIAIERTIERLDRGTYGICSVCGERIPADRLEALPSTPHCVRCVAAGEGR
jgi:RNA polymerase-binding transcription factor DksA